MPNCTRKCWKACKEVVKTPFFSRVNDSQELFIGNRVNLKNSQDFLRILEKDCKFMKFSEISGNFQEFSVSSFIPSRTYSREYCEFRFDKVIQNTILENSQELSGVIVSLTLICALYLLFSG